jgi:hypothetical protein
MQRSSETIGAIAGAPAKVQIELASPEKPLTATIRSPFARESDRSFRYASLSSGLELVRKSLSRHEIASVQTTSIDEGTRLIRLAMTLAHSSGEWVSSDWPVCPVSETSALHRRGAALTYARCYALFTLVGIAGEDDVEAPDLSAGMENAVPHPDGTSEPNRHIQQGARQPGSRANASAFADRPAASPYSRQGRPVRLPRVILGPENSTALRERQIAEVGAFKDTEALTVWAGRILPEKNQLTTSDALCLEAAFAAKLGWLEADRPPENEGNSGSDPANPKHTASPELNGHRGPRLAHEQGSDANVRSNPAADKPVTPIGKTLRMRDRDHLKFVIAQPCVVCARSPSDAHHLKFAQERALGRKVSDEFAVPLCRTHHRELHLRGDERTWWQQFNVDPMRVASALWARTRSAVTLSQKHQIVAKTPKRKGGLRRHAKFRETVMIVFTKRSKSLRRIVHDKFQADRSKPPQWAPKHRSDYRTRQTALPAKCRASWANG